MVAAQQPKPAEADEGAIRKMVESYQQAFNQGDAKALAELWSPAAVYTNRLTGETVIGRAAIGEQFTSLFAKNKNLKLDLATESIQFLAPSVAVEHGVAKFIDPNADSEEIQYTAVYVKRDERWLLDRVTDEEQQIVNPRYEQLKPLEWMVGRWTTHAPNARVQLDCNWTKNRNFLTRSFSVAIDDLEFSGMQVIGWDPSAKTIRSWTFDSEGTFAEATWTQQGDQWFLRNKGVLADGRLASMVNVMKYVDENSFTWQTIERTAGGSLLPNIDEVLIVRQ
jgi:uncharacterized protein (TIGR02246 family)